MKNELVIVIDFGGQYNQLVARRVRECNVYCEIYSYKVDIEKIKEMNPKGIILTGGPNSCYLEDSPTYSKELFELGIPVLGLCYGAQLMQHVLGGKVERANKIKVTAKDTDGNIIKIKAEGFFARTIQHEVDHLDGILFTSHIKGKTLSQKEFDEMVEKQKDE